MMRSLWTAASGMKTQQLYVDSISNNIANVNTSGFKKENMEFRSLFYESLSPASTNEEGVGRPVGIHIGHGVRTVANYKDFTQGSVDITNRPLDFSIDGEGFFVVEDINGNQMYTKQGSFKTSIVGNQLRLTTSDGYPILSNTGDYIDFEGSFLATNLSIDSLGNLGYAGDDGNSESLNMRVGLVQFQNPAGLDAIGGTFYHSTSASGEARYEGTGNITSSNLTQGTVEASNVQVVEEMVKLIVAQRAYEMNSKSIQTSDDMLSLVNQLKR